MGRVTDGAKPPVREVGDEEGAKPPVVVVVVSLGVITTASLGTHRCHTSAPSLSIAAGRLARLLLVS